MMSTEFFPGRVSNGQSFGPNHGVYMTNPGGAGTGGDTMRVRRFFQKASIAELERAGAVRADGSVLMDTGVRLHVPVRHALLVATSRAWPVSDAFPCAVLLLFDGCRLCTSALRL